MFFNFNVAAKNICNNMSMLSKRMERCVMRLSTGKRINSAADDAAGLSISQKMQAQIRGLNMATRNVQDGISLIQVAEGSLNEVHSILQRMKELSVQAANDTNSVSERSAMKQEIDQLTEELKRISGATEFNEKKLLNGSSPNIQLQVGPNQGDTVTINMGNLADVISKMGTIDISSNSAAGDAMTKLGKAIESVSRMRSGLGATQNRLEGIIRMNENYAENLEAAESRITDADMAAEAMEFAKVSILQQVNIALLSQMGVQSKWILKLFEHL